MESAGSTNLVGPWWYLRNSFPAFEGLFDTSLFCAKSWKSRGVRHSTLPQPRRNQHSNGNHGSAKHAHEAKRHAKTAVCGVCQICVSLRRRQAPRIWRMVTRPILPRKTLELLYLV
jgi:hypothetical protein